MCSAEKVFLEISQNSYENTCARVSFLIKLQARGLQLYYEREPGKGVFLWILRNFYKNTFSYNTPTIITPKNYYVKHSITKCIE